MLGSPSVSAPSDPAAAASDALSANELKATYRWFQVSFFFLRNLHNSSSVQSKRLTLLMRQRRDPPLFGPLLGSCLCHILSETPVSPLQTDVCQSRTPAEIRTDRASSPLNEGLNDLIAVRTRRPFLRMQPHEKPQPLMCACCFNEPS